jgi:hypothetical protein
MFNFGRQNPNPTRGTADETGLAGTLIGDLTGGIGGFMTHGGNSAGGNMMGAAGGAVGNIMLGVSEISQGQYAGGIGDLASGVLNGAQMIPGLSNMPGIGIAAGAASAVGHGIEAARHVDEIDGGYQNNQFWTEAGWATVGAANAIAAADPTGLASLYVGGTTFALDGLGALSGMVLGEDYRFSAGSAIGALEHGVFDTGQAIAAGAVGAYDWATSGGPGRALGAVGDGIGTAANWVGGGLSSIGGGLSSIGSAIGSFLSDEQFKTDVQPMIGALDRLLAL